ncbi:hypothetical protein ACNKHT_10400 [Shigella flexneri]
MAAFTDATPTTLDDIPLPGPARLRGNSVHIADRVVQKITHEKTHSRNLIIPARSLQRNNPSLSAIPGSVLSSRLMIKIWHTGGAFYFTEPHRRFMCLILTT